jgi:phytoene dehydrogenase-like protein
MPFIQDFGLYDLGYRDVYPDAQVGIAFKDGRPPIVLYRAETEEDYQRSYKSIAYYSKHDAETWVRCRKTARQLEPMFTKWFYSPPTMPTEQMPEPLVAMGQQMMEAFGLPKQYLYSAPMDVINYLFESPEMRTMFYKACEDYGTPFRSHGLGFGALMSIFFILNNNRLAVGGTHTLAHAMAMAATREGVDIHERCPVKKVIVENGVATGIELEDGRIFNARKMVASNADLKQSLLGMLGRENMSEKWIKQTEHYKYGHSMVLCMANMALHEPPNYKSAVHNADINKTFVTFAGAETPEDMILHSQQVEMGIEPSVKGPMPLFCSVPSLFSPGYAPEGKANLYCCWFSPNASAYSEKEWREISNNLLDLTLENYVQYAPNMTRDNVIGCHPVTPYALEKENLMPEGDFFLGAMRADQLGHNRPFPEAAQYKTEVENFYLCSSGSHPMGGISTGVGYASYKKVAEDFKLSYKPWEKHPRGY